MQEKWISLQLDVGEGMVISLKELQELIVLSMRMNRRKLMIVSQNAEPINCNTLQCVCDNAHCH